MGADLYAAGLLGLTESVAVPHKEIHVKQISSATTVRQVQEKDSSIKDESVPSKEEYRTPIETSIKLAKEIGTDFTFKREIVWFNAIGFLVLHLCGVYGVYLMFSGEAKIWTTIYCKRTVFPLPLISF